MAKTAVGSILQKVVIEGDENLLTTQEILIQKSDEFKLIWKERKEDGSVETSVLIPIEKYIADLEDAFNNGIKSK